MKDARGQKIEVGDVVLYGSVGGVKRVTAAKVLKVGRHIRVEVLSTTYFGPEPGRELDIGLSEPYDGCLLNVMVIQHGGRAVNTAKRLLGTTYNEKTRARARRGTPRL